MSINPTGLIKIMGALAPMMGDPKAGEQVVTEIKAVFDAIKTAAEEAHLTRVALNRIENGITDIRMALKMPLAEDETMKLLEHHRVNGMSL